MLPLQVTMNHLICASVFPHPLLIEVGMLKISEAKDWRNRHKLDYFSSFDYFVFCRLIRLCTYQTNGFGDPSFIQSAKWYSQSSYLPDFTSPSSNSTTLDLLVVPEQVYPNRRDVVRSNFFNCGGIEK